MIYLSYSEKQSCIEKRLEIKGIFIYLLFIFTILEIMLSSSDSVYLVRLCCSLIITAIAHIHKQLSVYSHGHQIRRVGGFALLPRMGPVKRRKAQIGNAVCTLLPSPSVGARRRCSFDSPPCQCQCQSYCTV
ncbi:hypothetical protein J6590_019466 [Homalodisca vitripennis]|nr:hypothetical protein J6590_019466 [Homalodisca vitripennis]